MNDVPASPLVTRAKWLAGATVILLVLGAVVVMMGRSFRASALEQSTALHAVQYVAITQPVSGGSAAPLTLPGTLQGSIETTLYARSSGYVRRWNKDIGASVRKGEVLAEIAAPEIDHQLVQAQAAQRQAAASAALAKNTAERWRSLRERDAVTQQEVDERVSAAAQAQADLAAAAANVSRLQSLQDFSRVVAPFDGVLTRRSVDVGELVNAGNGGAGQALFSVAQVDPLRLYVYVPQAYADQVKIGDPVNVFLAERASAKYRGAVERTARAIDPATRTLQVEIRIPNPQGALLAGAYVQAELPLQGDRAALLVPTNVLLFRPEGPRIAVVDGGGRVRLAPVRLGTDFGTSIEILEGLEAGSRLIVNPADSLADGDVVSVAPASPAAGQG